MRKQFARKTMVASLAAAGLLSVSGAFAADAAMIAARVKFFGGDNVDASTGAVKKDKVIFSWPGHVSGVLSLQGRVVLLDSYIARLETTALGRTPIVVNDLVDLRPEAIFVGHGHGDHADNAAYIAAKTGATLYMTPEACGTAQTALARMKADPFMQADPAYAIPQNATVTCVGLTTAGSTPGTEVVRIKQLEPLVCINSFRSFHSVAVPVDPNWGPNAPLPSPDPRDADLFPPGIPLTPSNPRQAGQQDLRQGNGPGGTDELVYQFVVRSGYNFSMFWNNSIGALKEGKGSNWPDGVPADGQRVLGLLRSLPNTDLSYTTDDSNNLTNNGWRDNVYWAEAMRPKILTTGHAPIGNAIAWYSGLKRYFNMMEQPKNDWVGFPRAQWPVIRSHTDPTDILKPEIYSTGDPYWANPEKQAKMAQFCS